MVNLTDRLKDFVRYQRGSREIGGFTNFYSNVLKSKRKYIHDLITRSDMIDATDLTIRYLGTTAEVAYGLSELLGYSIGIRNGPRAAMNVAVVAGATEAFKYIMHRLIQSEKEFKPLTPYPGGMKGLRRTLKKIREMKKDQDKN